MRNCLGRQPWSLLALWIWCPRRGGGSDPQGQVWDREQHPTPAGTPKELRALSRGLSRLCCFPAAPQHPPSFGSESAQTRAELSLTLVLDFFIQLLENLLTSRKISPFIPFWHFLSCQKRQSITVGPSSNTQHQRPWGEETQICHLWQFSIHQPCCTRALSLRMNVRALPLHEQHPFPTKLAIP